VADLTEEEWCSVRRRLSEIWGVKVGSETGRSSRKAQTEYLANDFICKTVDWRV
jgi:hypothetical protein